MLDQCLRVILAPFGSDPVLGFLDRGGKIRFSVFSRRPRGCHTCCVGLRASFGYDSASQQVSVTDGDQPSRCPTYEDNTTMPTSHLITRAPFPGIVAAGLTLTIILTGCVYNYHYCKRKEAEYIRIGTGIIISVNRRNSEELYDLYGATIEYYTDMRYKYHYAAWHPWLTLMPDPPKPKLNPQRQ
jgi:hypothetical protein